MTIWDTLALGSIQFLFVALLLAVIGVISYTLEKIGFYRWLRGWSWYFGFVDSEKEPEYTDEEIPGFFDRKKDR